MFLRNYQGGVSSWGGHQLGN